MDKVTVALPRGMVEEIRAAVAAGEFGNASEVEREALRHWQSRRTVLALNEDELRRLVAEGRGSGEPVEGDIVLERLRAKYAAMAAEPAD